MTFALVHLECAQCVQMTWAVIPVAILDEPLRCGWCEDLTMFPAFGEAVQIVPETSPLVYDWFHRDPERVLVWQ